MTRDEATPPRDGRRILPIRWVVALSSLLMTTAVVLSVEVVAERSTRQALTDDLVARLCGQSRSLAALSSSALLTPFPELTLHPLLLRMRQQQPELVVATVCDMGGTVRGDADPRRLGQPFSPPAGLIPGKALHPPTGVEISQSGQVLMVSSLIRHPNGLVLGRVYVAVQRTYIEHAVREARRPVLWMFVLFVALGAIGSFLLISTLLRPIGILRAGLERIGQGELETRLSLDPRTELGRLASTINQMASDLSHGQRETIERERLAHELRLAQRIQRGLLPAERLSEGGLTVAGKQVPASEVGGDFYDVFRLPDGRIGIAVADVAGKGLGGCLVTSMLAVLLIALRDSCSGPAALIAALDKTLSRRLDRGSFLTLFVAFIEPKTGELVYASAGHHPALLLHRNGGGDWLESPGLPIGADRQRGVQATLNEQTRQLAPGDTLIQTTDGIHETEHEADGEAFGFERQLDAARRAGDGDSQAMVGALADEVAAWRGGAAAADDQTIVVARWDGVPVDDAADPLGSPLARLADAQSRGTPLRVPATLEALARLGDWLVRAPAFSTFSESWRDLAHLTLYELCSNIVEHGTPSATAEPLALWWVPDPVDGSGTPHGGHFVILDQGSRFSADTIVAVDLDDPATRRRGRGFGLHLAQRAARLRFHPGTPAGNVTIMSLVADPTAREGEAA